MIAYLARATACFPEIDYCHDGVGWVIVGCGVCDVCGVGAAYRVVDRRRKGVRRESCIDCLLCSTDFL
jgi:NAD-dependent dihydropyrimidine dehydrogenase PreA subunit